ncbi:MAG: cupin domain-containing protein [Granulosicoccus sp.]
MQNRNDSPEWLHTPNEQHTFFTKERCTITELLNHDESPDVSVAKARVDHGVTTQLHSLQGVTEHYIILSGEGIMSVNGQKHIVKAGDRVTIWAGVPQQIENTGSAALEFYCICNPRFTPACYVSLEA